MTAPASKEKIPSLDGIRAIAVMIVLIAHCSPEYRLPSGFGVTVFFFLSGYLITRLFFREMERTGRVALGPFYLRRLLRLTPPLVIVLALGAIGVALGVTPGALDGKIIASQLLYFFNYYTLYFREATSVGIGGAGVYWSLAVEEHFYLLYPLVFIGLARLKSGLRRIQLLAAVLVGALLWRVFLATIIGVSSDHLYMASDARLDSILYGCLLAFLQREGVMARIAPLSAWPMAIGSAAAGCVVLATFVYRDPLFRDTLRYSLQGLALMPLFHYAVMAPALPHHRILNAAPVMRIGVYSYTIYLVHKMIAVSFWSVAGGPQGPVATIAVTFSLSLFLAALIHAFVERPVSGLRARLHAGQAQSSSPFTHHSAQTG